MGTSYNTLNQIRYTFECANFKFLNAIYELQTQKLYVSQQSYNKCNQKDKSI